MDALNNKRYYMPMFICRLLLYTCLCTCFTVSAQEMSSEIIDNQPTVIFQSELLKPEAPKSDAIVGLASYYATKFHGRRTASGERFNDKLLTAAHLTLPFGTQLKVTNLRNMKFVIVRVNDRGPHVRGRIVDLSRAAAEMISMRQSGTARVELEVLKL